MKKILFTLSSLILLACGDDSGSNSDTSTGNSGNINNEDFREVESIKDLNRCSDEREGDTVYVADQMRDYLCHNHAWIDLFELLEETNSSSSVSTSSSSNSTGESDADSSSSSDKSEAGSSSSMDESEVSNSSSSGKNENGSTSSTGENETDSSSSIDKREDNNSSSSDKNEAGSSSSMDESEVSNSSSSSKNEDSSSSSESEREVVKPITNLNITGIAQKGPFNVNSVVTVHELKEDLSLTSKTFKGTVTGWDGKFSVNNVSLTSPYVLLEVNGGYINEVDGKNRSLTIKLNAYADLSDSKTVSINVLTHLEYYRVRELMANDGTLKLKDAKKQAQKEIFAAFGIDATNFNANELLNIFGTSDQSAALLAMSILLMGERNENDLTALLTTLGKDIAKDGRWDDAATRTTIVNWAFNIDKETAPLSKKIRSNMTSWRLGDVPAFEKYVRNFWYHEYGLGSCDESNKNEVKRSTNSIYYVCLDDRWERASEARINTVHYECNKNGELLKGLVNTDKYYTCDADTFRVETDVIAIFLEKSCNDYTESSDVVSSKNGTEWTCENSKWVWDGKAVLGTMTDARDGKVYKTTTIDTLPLWMAENLNYDYNEGTAKSYCYSNSSANCDKYGRLYLWSAAMDSAGVFTTTGKGCGYYGVTCSPSGMVRGVCPEGWHLPSNSDWNTLWTAVGGTSTAGTKLKSTSGWNSNGNGEDSYGFSVLPAGRYYNGSYYDAGYRGDFWSSTESDSYNAYYKYFSNNSSVYENRYDKNYGFSVRCLKD